MPWNLVTVSRAGNGGVDKSGGVGLGRGVQNLTSLSFALGASLALSACSGSSIFRRDAAPRGADPSVAVIEAPGAEITRPIARSGAESAPAPGAPVIAPQGRTAAALDRTTEAERDAAATTARSAEGQRLGETLAALGAPGEAGFWLVTGLVDRARPGRVVAPSGATLAVELRPSGGAAGGGSQISLPALRMLGLPLTGLATLQVFALD